ncbi:hypothetical protein Xoosp13_138 [Xanthomonas phage Xoo-sp13]|nr:hypothetical protein Xoosp13_138 [Xanthomonas phage Xoo-sp13]
MKWYERLWIGAGVLVFVLLIGGCIRWQWDECRSVGHGVMYCLWSLGN